MTSSPLSSPTGAVVKKASDLWSSEDAEDDLDASTGSIRKNVGRTQQCCLDRKQKFNHLQAS